MSLASVSLPSDSLYRVFFARALSHASCLGADSGECFRALHDAGKSPPAASWHRAWTKMAARLDEHALSLLDAKPARRNDARNASLRASNYHRAAFSPYFGHPLDKEVVMTSYKAMRASFRAAAQLFDPPFIPLEIPYKDTTLRGYLALPPTAAANGRLMVALSGYDAPLEEMYFWTGHHALQNGYAWLSFDGPGQGGTLLEGGVALANTYDEAVLAALGVAAEHGAWTLSVLHGLSLGGLLCLSAAAQDAVQGRIAAVVADPGELGLEQAFRERLPFPRGIADRLPREPAWAVSLLGLLLGRMAGGAGAGGWVLRRGMLVHGTTTPLDFVRTLHEFDNAPVLGKIRVPTLVTHAMEDGLAGQAKVVFEKLTACEKKEYMQFSDETGAGEHCELGARSFYSEKVFAWLDDVLSDTAERSDE